jgi:hypothetical protein
MKAFVFLLILSSPFSFAAPIGKILKLKGLATYQGKAIQEGQSISGKGEIGVGDKSYLKFTFEDAGHIVVLGGNSKLDVDFSQKVGEEKVTLVEGITRWVSGKVTKKDVAGVSTKLAIMGIRGTDFLVTAHPIWGETETICFKGEISFTNSTNKVDSTSVGAGQWGGLGGRFGKKIGAIINLEPHILKYFNEAIPVE